MKKAFILTFALSTFAGSAMAEEEVVYSNEEYCILEHKLGDTSQEVQGYARKLQQLGVGKPSPKVCSHFISVMREALPPAKEKVWDFPNRAPYPGSAVRLKLDTIKKIKALRASKK